MYLSSKDLFNLVHKTIRNMEDLVLEPFIMDLPSSDNLLLRELKPTTRPVVKSVHTVGKSSVKTKEMVEAIKSNSDLQTWRQPYKPDDFGAEFFNKIVWFPIADIEGPIVYSKGLVEVMLMDSNVAYPGHSHNPEEIYIVLAGKVWWEAEGSIGSPCWKNAGEVIHHIPNQVHSVTAGEKPVLILSLWRGGSFEMPSII